MRKKLRNDAIINELRSLRDLRSFRMVTRPRGVNILKLTLAFKKNKYPDSSFKKKRTDYVYVEIKIQK